MFLDVVKGSNLPLESEVLLRGRTEEFLYMLLTVGVLLSVASNPPLAGDLLDCFVSSTTNLRAESEGEVRHLVLPRNREDRLRVYCDHALSHNHEVGLGMTVSVAACSDCEVFAPEYRLTEISLRYFNGH